MSHVKPSVAVPFTLTLSLLLSACGTQKPTLTTPTASTSTSPVTAQNVSATLSVTKTTGYQFVSGFGATANHPVEELRNFAEPARTEVLDFLFKASGLDLSVVRLEINPFQKTDPNPINALQATFQPSKGVWDWNTDTHQKWLSAEAKKRFVTRYIAVPWSAPRWMKTNDKETNGGSLKSDALPDLVDYFERYLLHYSNVEDINVGWLSIQNEPENALSWATMQYSNTQMKDAVEAVLARFNTNKIWTKVVAPEAATAARTKEYLDAMGPTTVAKLGAIATHIYDDNVTYDPAISNYGKPVWMTEISNVGPEDASIGQGLFWAKNIRDRFNEGVNAYLYWWLVRPTTDTTAQALVNLGAGSTYSIPKRAYSFGQFSRFVRPGYQRVASSSSTTNLKQIAFKDPATNKGVIIVINDSSTEYSATLTGLTATNTKWYRTSASESLTQLSDLSVSSGSVTRAFPARSVTTIVEDINDTSAPSAVTNLAAASNVHGVLLTWSAPGNSGTVGTANEFEIRRSSSPITDSNYAAAAIVKGAPSPQSHGTAQSYIVTGLGSGTHYFAIKSKDEAGNVSSLSNVTSITR